MDWEKIYMKNLMFPTMEAGEVVKKLRTKEDLAGKIGARFEADSTEVIRFLSSNDSLAPYQLDTNTAQTPGMNRAAAINLARVGAQKIWAGTVHIHANAKTGAHHHGALESVIYVVKGKARMREYGSVSIPQEAFIAALRMGDEG